MKAEADTWREEPEEPLAPWVRRALLSVEESEGLEGPLPLDLRLVAEAGDELSDEREEPVRGSLRRALLAADP